jgi:hypothetical protein
MQYSQLGGLDDSPKRDTHRTDPKKKKKSFFAK